MLQVRIHAFAYKIVGQGLGGWRPTHAAVIGTSREIHELTQLSESAHNDVRLNRRRIVRLAC